MSTLQHQLPRQLMGMSKTLSSFRSWHPFKSELSTIVNKWQTGYGCMFTTMEQSSLGFFESNPAQWSQRAGPDDANFFFNGTVAKLDNALRYERRELRVRVSPVLPFQALHCVKMFFGEGNLAVDFPIPLAWMQATISIGEWCQW